jgi:hypothetical protein
MTDYCVNLGEKGTKSTEVNGLCHRLDHFIGEHAFAVVAICIEIIFSAERLALDNRRFDLCGRLKKIGTSKGSIAHRSRMEPAAHTVAVA